MTSPTPYSIDPWPVRFPCDVSTKSPTVTGGAVQFATEVLWALTARQFGLTTVTFEPEYRDNHWHYVWPWQPLPGLGFRWFWPWVMITEQMCQGNQDLRMPTAVNSITSIAVDGVTVDPSAYRIVSGEIVQRIDGNYWPSSGIVITAVFGNPPPTGVELAVGELACEFIKALGGEDCRLPKNVTNIARQGVTITMPDPTQMFVNGLTGLYISDNFIRTWNPKGLKQRSKTYSVDSQPLRRLS